MELELKRKIRVAPDEILRLIEKKAAIFEGICEIGVIAGNGSEGQIKALKAVGRAFGYLVMLREEFIDMFESAELSSRLKNEYPPLPILYAIENHKVKKTVASLRRSRRITEDAIQELVSVVYEDRNVIKLKETMTVKAMQTIELLNAHVMKKEPASKLALLLRGTLEDLK
jgi:geranylgeranyl pyrophosphate synthase